MGIHINHVYSLLLLFALHGCSVEKRSVNLNKALKIDPVQYIVLQTYLSEKANEFGSQEKSLIQDPIAIAKVKSWLERVHPRDRTRGAYLPICRLIIGEGNRQNLLDLYGLRIDEANEKMLWADEFNRLFRIFEEFGKPLDLHYFALERTVECVRDVRIEIHNSTGIQKVKEWLKEIGPRTDRAKWRSNNLMAKLRIGEGKKPFANDLGERCILLYEGAVNGAPWIRIDQFEKLYAIFDEWGDTKEVKELFKIDCAKKE